MTMFHSCFIESVLTSSFVWGFGSLPMRNKNLQGIVVGIPLNDLSICKKSILADSHQPLHIEFSLLPSDRRLLRPKYRTNRLKNSFVPAAVVFLNDNVILHPCYLLFVLYSVLSVGLLYFYVPLLAANEKKHAFWNNGSLNWNSMERLPNDQDVMSVSV